MASSVRRSQCHTMRNVRHSLAVIGLALSLMQVAPMQASAGSPNAAPVAHIARMTIAADHCFADWSDAGPIVRREALVAVKVVHELARQHKIGDLVKVTLCEENGRFVYRLVVREPTGRIVALTTDARRPFDR